MPLKPFLLAIRVFPQWGQSIINLMGELTRRQELAAGGSFFEVITNDTDPHFNGYRLWLNKRPSQRFAEQSSIAKGFIPRLLWIRLKQKKSSGFAEPLVARN
jgi:hypothetical protein